MADQVSVVTAATGAVTFYSTYAAARSAASAGDLIQIWADLTDEQILLKNLVDIWIAPGRIIDMSDAKPTIVDNDTGYTSAVTCKIYGTGIIRNSYTSTSTWYECIKITNGASNVSIECDSIEGHGGIGTTSDPYKGASVLVNNITDNQKFSLTCNKVSNIFNAAIVFGSVSSGTNLNGINIQAQKIETGVVDDDAGTSALVIKGSGTIDIEEIVCLNKGACLYHQGGTIEANILKMTTKNLNNFSSFLPAILVADGDGTQDLTLLFDEIQNINHGDETAVGIKINQGRAKLIGRRIFAEYGLSIDLGGDIISADIQCTEIISGTSGININNSDEPVIIDSNYIEGSTDNDGVIKSATNSNYVLRNAKIKCTDTSSNSVCIFLPSGAANNQTIELENVILVTGNTSTGDTIRRDTTNVINIKNYGLFVNKAIDRTVIILKIGTGTEGNYKYIQSSDIT